jgi:hypothetical protein
MTPGTDIDAYAAALDGTIWAPSALTDAKGTHRLPPATARAL